MRLTANLWSHQQQIVDFAYQNMTEFGYAWWIVGCRLGKTLSSLALIQELTAKKTLVITKKAAILSAWRADIQNFTEGLDYALVEDRIITQDETTRKMSSKQKTAFLRDYVDRHDGDNPVIVVINYETARIIAKELGLMGFTFVIADESHALKSYSSKTSVELAKALRHVPYKLNMTGTAWDNRPTDVYGQVRFLSSGGSGRYPYSKHFGKWSEFFDRYVNYYMMGHQKIPKGYKRLKELASEIEHFTIHVKTEDVLDLPPIRHIDYKLPMPKRMKDAYKSMEEHMIAEMGDNVMVASHILTQSIRLHELTSGYYRTEDGQIHSYLEAKDNPKLQQLLSILDEIGGEPVVVFTRFKQDVTLIAEALEDADISYNLLTGDVKEHVEWQENASAQVLIANIAAGGTGVTLSRASYIVYFSIGNNREDYTQSLYRIIHARAEKPIVYHHIMMEHSIDTELMLAMEGKEEVSTYLLQNIKNRLDNK